VPLQPCIYCTF